MAKFTWQNGTLVSKAKVEINGTIYEVDPEEYSGATPLSASNLNSMQDGIYDDIGDKTNLQTPVTNNLVGAINSIVESGSNENGYYTKFSDGTMMCYNNTAVSGGTWTSAGSGYTLSKTVNINFPQTFTTVISLTGNTNGGGDSIYANVGLIQYSESEITSINFNRLTNANSSYSIGFSYIAIGKWK